MDKSLKELQNIYEAHFYHELDQDKQNEYYSAIRQGIDPFAENCHKIAIMIDRLKNQIEDLFYTDEWNNLEQMIEVYTENPIMEKRDIQGYMMGIISDLRHSADKLSKENMTADLSDILTGQKIQ